MSIVAKPLISSRFAASTDNIEYTVPAATRTIIDKFTATNTDSAAQTVTVNLVANGSSIAPSNIIVSARSIAAGATADLSELQNQILGTSDFISIKAGASNKVVIRASGREIA